MRKSGRILRAGLVASAVLATSPALADSRWFSPDWFSGPWTVTLGAEGRVLPTYEGSSNYRFMPLPIFDIRRAGTPRRFKSSRDGASIGIIEFNNFRMGPTFKVRQQRREGDDAKLAGLGNVDFAIEVGIRLDRAENQRRRGQARAERARQRLQRIRAAAHRA